MYIPESCICHEVEQCSPQKVSVLKKKGTILRVKINPPSLSLDKEVMIGRITRCQYSGAITATRILKGLESQNLTQHRE